MESVWTLLIIGVVVGFNNLAVSFTLGALDQKKYFLRILFAFGLSEFTVPLIGAWLGKKISKLILEFTWWLGPFFLVVLGIVTFFSAGFSADRQDKLAEKLVSWKGLFILAIGLSFDNLIVGFSFGLQGISPLLLASTIAMFSISFAAVGLAVGSITKKNFDKITVKVTGVLLISLGILTFLEVV